MTAAANTGRWDKFKGKAESDFGGKKQEFEINGKRKKKDK
jgi:hypothetical protein